MEAAFFDLDKTVIAKASMVAFGKPLLDAGFISRRLLLRALWSNLIFHLFGAGEERMRKFRESALRITRGWDQAKITALVQEHLTDVIEPIVYDEALELIRAHQAAGRRVYLVSASPEEIVTPLAQFLRVDGAIASRARLDAHGRYTGEVEFYSYGPFKAAAIRNLAAREGLDLQHSFAYSDSATDVPMLEAVGFPVAVNPDRDLSRIARARGWEVRHFERGVPLRDRVALPPPKRTAMVGGVIVVLAAAIATYRWSRTKRRPDRRKNPREWRRATARPQRLVPRGRAAQESLVDRWAEHPASVLMRRLAASSLQMQRGRAGR
ncbi:MAG: HAD-IB family hydrolase [Acidimicrobiales bacterium]|nr:HAD-IB family hydrolase [Acidimicrobiales bacterium]